MQLVTASVLTTLGRWRQLCHYLLTLLCTRLTAPLAKENTWIFPLSARIQGVSTRAHSANNSQYIPIVEFPFLRRSMVNILSPMIYLEWEKNNSTDSLSSKQADEYSPETLQVYRILPANPHLVACSLPTKKPMELRLKIGKTVQRSVAWSADWIRSRCARLQTLRHMEMRPVFLFSYG